MKWSSWWTATHNLNPNRSFFQPLFPLGSMYSLTTQGIQQRDGHFWKDTPAAFDAALQELIQLVEPQKTRLPCLFLQEVSDKHGIKEDGTPVTLDTVRIPKWARPIDEEPIQDLNLHFWCRKWDEVESSHPTEAFIKYLPLASLTNSVWDLWTLLEQKAIIVRACQKYLFRDLSTGMTVSINSSKTSFSFHPNPPRTTYSKNCFLHQRQADFLNLLSLLNRHLLRNEIPMPLAHVITDQEVFEDVANRLHALHSVGSIYTAAKTWASMCYLLFTMILQVTNWKHQSCRMWRTAQSWKTRISTDGPMQGILF